MSKITEEITADRTVNGALAQLARASALQAECQGFESLKLHQFFEFKLLLKYMGLASLGSCRNGRIAQLVRARP